jgi:hypothetical protein
VRVRPPLSRHGYVGAPATSGDVPRARAATQTRQPAAADSSAITTHTREPRRQNRSSPNRRPDPVALRSHYSSPPSTCLPSRRLDSSPRSAHSPHPCPSGLPDPDPLPPPRLRPLQLPAWAGPARFYLDSRGSGVRREAADPTSSESPGGKPRKHPKAGRRPVALMGETERAKQMEGNTRRETGVPSASACLIPGASFTLLDHSTCDGAFDRMLADALVLVWRSSGAGVRSTGSDTLPVERRECSRQLQPVT